MRPAAQYLRMSTDQQKYSLENQATLIAAYAMQNGYQIVRTYEDAGRSGVTAAKRTGLRALLHDVTSNPPFTAVLVVDVSRWGRYQDPDEAAHYEYICRESGVRVEYCAEPFDDDGTPTAALMKSMKRVMAAEYSRQLSDRTRAGLRRAVMSGGRGGGHPPYGFSRQVFDADGTPGRILQEGELKGKRDQQVRIVVGPPEQVRVLRRIFELFVNDFLGLSEIAVLLNAEKVPHSREGPWNDQRVRTVLANEMAIGVFAFGRTDWRFGKRSTSNPRPDWLRHKATDAVISRKLFLAAQTRLATNQSQRITDQAMIEKLRRLLKAEGYLSRRLIDTTPGVPCVPTYIRRFGSMSAAYALAGYVRTHRRAEHVEPQGLQTAEILVRLTSLLETHGYLSKPLIDASPEVPHSDTIRRRLGPLEEVYRLVGYTASREEMLVAAWRRRRLQLTLSTTDASCPV